MKTSTKLLIAAACMVTVGVTLIILACTVLADPDFAGVGAPHFGALVPGIFITFFSIPLWFMGLMPRLAKAGARLHNEALDNAGADMSSAMQKSADIAAPAIKTVTTTVAQTIKTVSDTTESTHFCKACGKTIAADSTFCKHCGKKQD